MKNIQDDEKLKHLKLLLEDDNIPEYCMYKYKKDNPMERSVPENEVVYDCVEFHQDTSKEFIEDDLCYNRFTAIIGMLDDASDDGLEKLKKALEEMTSVRRPSDSPVELVNGQDEAVCKSHTFPSRMWVVGGEHVLLPKGDGSGVMVSLLVNAFFGASFNLTGAQLAKVNVARKDSNYVDTEAAKVVFRSTSEEFGSEDGKNAQVSCGVGRYWSGVLLGYFQS